MHLETIQHLRQVATQHDDTVPVAKSLLLDLLDSYEQHATQPVNKVTPVNPVPTPETFEAHGHTWTRHTPGDPCPVPDKQALVVVIFPDGEISCPDPAILWSWDSSHDPFIGWRYATPAPPPDAPPAAP